MTSSPQLLQRRRYHSQNPHRFSQISNKDGVCIISIKAASMDSDEIQKTSPSSGTSSPIKGIFRRQSRPMRKSAKALFQQFGMGKTGILTR
ncbi:hypothetical protein GCK72_008058 [Caenorhabditis remanei]|uniref:Uncharacterized protein n=1 Tax=Caenorhabditis remanei TaxID=31234 RepID=A0A6A5HP59_CAERE|nr:hypothetical protein GCK72_008058 [Caenorhabditis remanei]KAF1768097.1 hypothetical protein GCK72_008058 [Caenorhabditis remanei]